MDADRNLKDFQGRVARLERERVKGRAFGAEVKSARPRASTGERVWRVLGMLGLIVLCSIGLKGVLHHMVGAHVYEARVSELAAGPDLDRVAAFLMTPDIATRGVSAMLDSLFPSGKDLRQISREVGLSGN